MPGPCGGIRVVDLSQGRAGPLATMILSDFGADVVRVEQRQHDSAWTEPSYLLLNRGKRSILLDWDEPESRAEIVRLTAGSDVIVETFSPGEADRVGLGYEALSGVNTGLVHCSITPFGGVGPFAFVRADDALVMAKAGVFRDQPGWYSDGRRPVFRAARDGSYFAAMLAVQGILAALRARNHTGRGQRVETSLLQALAWRMNSNVGWLRREGEDLPPDSKPPGPRQPGIGELVECKDGRWISHSFLQPHFFPAWIDALGLEWIWEDDRFRGAPHQFADPETKDRFIRLIEDRMRERTAGEWMSTYLVNGNVCADVVETAQEALSHPQVVEGGYLVELDDPRVGRVLQIGSLAKIGGAVSLVRKPAPVPGEHTEQVLKSDVRPLPLPPPSRARLATPLDGITIVEVDFFVALSLGLALLSELGARVIKVEPLTGDPYRRLPTDNMRRAMQGKESLAVNLKDERGQRIVHQLIAHADVFAHNFRPGVPESLRIDYETLRAINPRLVYQYAGSYGSTGPYAGQPAIDNIITALCGQIAYQSGDGNPPLLEIGADPIAAAGAATALMLGLTARDRTGESQYVESAMIASNLIANFEDAMSYEGKPPRPSVDSRQLGTGATHRLYETSSSGDGTARWVFLAATGDDEFSRFCSVAGCEGLLSDSRFATTAARQDNRETLEALLEPIFRLRLASEWEASLLAVGVGCVRADAMSNLSFLYTDPQAKAMNLMTTVEHRSLGGTYWRHAPLINFSETPARAQAVCETGEHTRAILGELGYNDADVEELRSANVIGCLSDE